MRTSHGDLNRLTYLSILYKKHSKLPLDRIILGLSQHFGYELNEINVSQGSTTALVSLPPKIKLLDQTLWNISEGWHCASAYPILSAVNELRGPNGQYLRELAARVDRELPVLYDTPPPLSFACHDTIHDSVYVLNDYLGFGRAYYFDSGDVCLVSSSLLALAIAMPRMPIEDEEFWKQYYTWGFAVDDRTYLKSVSALKPGTRIILKEGTLRIEQTHGLGQLVQKYRHGDLPIQSPTEACREYFRLASSFYERSPIIGLSGGRDSRLIAALAISTNANCEYETRVPPTLEGDIARQLVEASPLPMDWSVLPSVYSTPTAGKENLIERAAFWFRQTDGDCWHSNIRKDVPQAIGGAGSFSNGKSARVSISGGAGEIARSHFYDTPHLGNPDERIVQYLKYIRDQNKLLPRHIKEQTAHAMELIFAEGKSFGIQGLHLLDYFFIRSRVKRAYPVPPGIFTPIMNLSVSLASFEMPPAEKIQGKLIRDMTVELVPQWGNIPYFHELAASRPQHEVNKTAVLPYYWETFGVDTYAQELDRALKRTALLPIKGSDVLRIVTTEDQNRWPQIHSTFERVLWHCGAVETLSDIRRLRSSVQIKWCGQRLNALISSALRCPPLRTWR